jgi:hypothetical protein
MSIAISMKSVMNGRRNSEDNPAVTPVPPRLEKYEIAPTSAANDAAWIGSNETDCVVATVLWL